MKLTFYTIEPHQEIKSHTVSHITMFDSTKQLDVTVLFKKDMLALIDTLLDHYVSFKVQGNNLSILFDEPTLRVKIRIDSK
jgi:hypothetical protein